MRTLVAGVLALLVLAACHQTPPNPNRSSCSPSLVILRFPSMTKLGRFRLPKNGRFALSFIHSVSGTPVRDDYRVHNGKVLQVSETFEAHGAGLPSGVWETNATGWEHRDGKFILRLQRPIGRLVVRTDRRYKNRLHLAGTVINLNQWEDQALELKIESCRP